MSDILVLGAGIAGMSAALDLANAGLGVYLLDKEKEIGGKAAHYACKAGSNCRKCSACLVPYIKYQLERHPNVRILPFSLCTDLQGEPGHFRASVRLLNEKRQDLGAETTLEVRALVVATGFDLYDPTPKEEFGYGRHRNVITALELEQALWGFPALSAAFGENLRRIGFIQCVGSRDAQNGYPYCSRICCGYSARQALKLESDLPGADITLFYQDRQTFGKGPGFFRRELGSHTHIRPVRGLPAKIFRYPRDELTVRYTDIEQGQVREEGFDLVVLCPAVIPARSGPDTFPALGLERDQNGFYLERDVGVSSRKGIFLAGTCQGPKDIPQSIAHAKAAVGRILRYLA
ncbi:Pyridine nucleotide disulphide reductase class-II [Acididesulfobacillus acetoxydans]|uniref:CoB--CoM heterodisulfide reductase iron-sulfur subunit A n=1 Tax=Acididesulfobacillus acetoxydans TaxID=1561005 RepID=A0A8S0W3M9_9FIRM|nr:FAD-dependent oxidoreductase [Acididesulfobacillus acetoxydans]CAA7601848.1 Pyridine nucleotide disulphide reductase class-II [Acididesulfobacillus acetoxydans]CEJ06845.1 CoB--CoM heterodisulfide reductase iron-sulfur subunit A [Acididesulfobacillus acetoxydans]